MRRSDDGADDRENGLSSSVFSNDYNDIHRFIDEIESDMTHVNSSTTGGEVDIPFGGIKDTGLGAL
jgi:aldehyde dehydrogenase (NAD+)